jgi:nicotinate-nucleotide pyrophosphorylase (carboxylating)
MNDNLSDPIINALHEDIGEGDITTEYLVPASLQASARIVAREPAVIAGTETAAEVFRRVDTDLRTSILTPDGSTIENGVVILEIHGAARSILKAERVALNFLQRLSGIATLTRQFVEAAGKSRAKILDTRKTTPGLRKLEKAAVVAGGGFNHRFGLYDMVLVKDNHLRGRPDLFSELNAMVQRIRQERPNVQIELEADNLEQVRAFLQIEGVAVILLDNMEPSGLREAIALRKNNPVKFEASGGVTLKNVRRIAATGVDFISVGALTHSARAIDLSLEMTNAAT